MVEEEMVKPPKSWNGACHDGEIQALDRIPFSVEESTSQPEERVRPSMLVAVLYLLGFVGLMWFPIGWILDGSSSSGHVGITVVSGGFMIAVLGFAAWREHGPNAQ